MTGAIPGPTERLEFRTWRRDDAELAVSLWTDPTVSALIARAPPTRTDAILRLEREIASMETNGFQYWPVFARNDGAHVGCCGLKPNDPTRHVLELGFHLRPTHWNKGYATEAARAVVAFAFEVLGAEALFAGHHPENTASRTVLLRLGFAYTHHALFPPTGLEHPSYLLRPSDIRMPQR